LGKSKKSIYSKIGFLPERPYFYPHLTGREFLTYLGNLNEVSNSAFLKKVDEYSLRLDLKDHLNKKINYYSKGMMQRLGLISCLVHSPLLLILDEPLSGVDPLGRREIKEILLEQNDSGKTIFFSSHILSEVEEICDRIVILDSGIVKFQGNKKDLLPKNSSFIVKFSGKPEKINPIFILDIKKRGEDIILETPEETLPDFLNEIIAQKSILHSINRKNSTIDEAVYGIGK
jgi:ABC-2 type transport system ATP-binding protein